MENFNDIVATVQLTLLVLAIPVVKLLLAWRDLLEAKTFREEEAANKDHTQAIMAMVDRMVVTPSQAKAMLVDDEDGDE